MFKVFLEHVKRYKHQVTIENERFVNCAGKVFRCKSIPELAMQETFTTMLFTEIRAHSLAKW